MEYPLLLYIKCLDEDNVDVTCDPLTQGGTASVPKITSDTATAVKNRTKQERISREILFTQPPDSFTFKDLHNLRLAVSDNPTRRTTAAILYAWKYRHMIKHSDEINLCERTFTKIKNP